MVSSASNFIIGFNRDELRSRKHAHPPSYHVYGRTRAIHPVDADQGGTWIAINDAGIFLGLLNHNEDDANRRVIGPVSRGKIIPSLLSYRSIDDIKTQIQQIDVQQYSSFVLTGMQNGNGFTFRYTGFDTIYQELQLPGLLTSTGLGDGLVRDLRKKYFDEMISTSPNLQEIKDYHLFSIPDQEKLGIHMVRKEARTVSSSFITLSDSKATWEYLDFVEDDRFEKSEYELTIIP
jgi:hypothetical protein